MRPDSSPTLGQEYATCISKINFHLLVKIYALKVIKKR
jgi:hypothetical protein